MKKKSVYHVNKIVDNLIAVLIIKIV